MCVAERDGGPTLLDGAFTTDDGAYAAFACVPHLWIPLQAAPEFQPPYPDMGRL